jgi:uncharacterized DUF497 family protein
MAGFEWDEAKNRLNVEKHGVSFEQAQRIFDRPILAAPDPRAYGEERWICIGRVGATAMLTVVFTERRGKRRLISARPASRKERRRYEEAI